MCEMLGFLSLKGQNGVTTQLAFLSVSHTRTVGVHIQTERRQLRFSDRLFLNIYADEEQSVECVIYASLCLCVNVCLAAFPHSCTPLSTPTHL